jgi:hypothetical protein
MSKPPPTCHKLSYLLLLGTLLVIWRFASRTQPVPTTLVNPFLNERFGAFFYGSSGQLFETLHAQWHSGNVVDWALVEPVQGARHWEQLAGLESQLLAHQTVGVTPIVRVWEVPEWAQVAGGYDCGPIEPSKLDAFGDFMYDLTVRLSAPPYNVRYIELWNEPDLDPALLPDPNHGYWGCWGNAADPYYGGGAYAEMLAVVYPRIKQANPSVQVLIGGLLAPCHPQIATSQGCINNIDGSPLPHPQASQFFAGILQRNGKQDGAQYFDVVNFHAYDFYNGSLGQYGDPNWGSTSQNGALLLQKSAYFREALGALGVNPLSKQYLASEASLLCFRACDGYEATLPSYIAQLYGATYATHLTATLYFPLSASADFGMAALLDSQNQLKPLAQVYVHSATQLYQAEFLGRTVPIDGLQGYRFRTADGRELWLVWSSTTAPTRLHLPRRPAQVSTLTGETLPAEQDQMVGTGLFIVFR